MSSCRGCPYTLLCSKLGVGGADWVNFFECPLCGEHFVRVEFRSIGYWVKDLFEPTKHRCPWGYIKKLCPECVYCTNCQHESKDCMPRVRCTPAKLESNAFHAREANNLMKTKRRFS